MDARGKGERGRMTIEWSSGAKRDLKNSRPDPRNTEMRGNVGVRAQIVWVIGSHRRVALHETDRR